MQKGNKQVSTFKRVKLPENKFKSIRPKKLLFSFFKIWQFKKIRKTNLFKEFYRVIIKDVLTFFPCAGTQYPSVPAGLSGGRRCVHGAELFPPLSSSGPLTSSLQLHDASLESDTAPHLQVLGE